MKDETETRSCQVCLSKNVMLLKEYTESNVYLVKCNKCGFVYFNKVFPESMLFLHYNFLNRPKKEREKIKIEFNQKKYDYFFNFAKAYKKSFNPEKALDIGFGAGYFLAAAKKLGVNVFGCEYGKKQIDFAEKKFKLKNLYLGSVFDCKFKKNSFDLIFLHHVIEHIVRPRKVIEECCRILKCNGILAVVSPNYGDYRFLFRKHKQLRPINHINYFTNNTMIKMVAESFDFSLTKNPCIGLWQYDLYYGINHLLKNKLNLFQLWLTFQKKNKRKN